MARNGSGVYSLPASTLAVSGDTISSTKFNSLVQDLESDANVDRPIAAGGTGASSASAARTNLGLEIGADVQAFDAGLLSIAGLTTAADKMIYTTALDTYAVTDLSAFGRSLIDDASAGDALTTLGVSAFAQTILDDADASAVLTTIGAQPLDATLTAFAGISFSADEIAYATGADTFSTTSLTSFARTFLDDANAAAVRTTLGLVIGTNVQAWDADLDTYAATPLTAAELGELQNIDTTTISAAQWGYLGGTDQALATTDDVVFASSVAPLRSNTTNGTMVSGWLNKMLWLNGNITLAGSIASADDMIGPMLAQGASKTISKGTITTMYVNGVSASSATLAERGQCTAVFKDAATVYLYGDLT